MGSTKFLGTMDEWMRDQEKRMTSVERRRNRNTGGGGGGSTTIAVNDTATVDMTLTGSGSPYVLSADVAAVPVSLLTGPGTIAGSLLPAIPLTVTDSATVDFTLTGAGTAASPYNLTATATGGGSGGQRIWRTLVSTTAQTLATAVATKINWTPGPNDPGNVAGGIAFDGTTATVPQDGVYQIGGTLTFAASAAGTFRNVQLFTNGALRWVGYREPSPAAVITSITMPALSIYLTAGSTVEVYGRHDAGANLATHPASGFCTWSIALVGSGGVPTAALQVSDTPTVDLTLTGAGTAGSPWNVSAAVLTDPASNPNTIPIRNASGQIAAAVPTSGSHVVNKSYLEGTSGAVLGVIGRKYRVVAGVIRNDGGSAYWQPINDAVHQPTNIDSCTTTTDRITIDYSSIGATKVVSFIAIGDEQLAKRGIVIGPSVGVTSTYLMMTSSLPYADFVQYDGSAWVSQNGVFTLSYNASNGRLTCTHPSIPSAEVFNTSVTGRGALVAYSDGAGQTSATVAWRDYAGTVQLVASTNQRAFVTHGPSGLLDPQQVTTTLYPSSNIWVYGIFEVA